MINKNNDYYYQQQGKRRKRRRLLKHCRYYESKKYVIMPLSLTTSAAPQGLACMRSKRPPTWHSCLAVEPTTQNSTHPTA